MILGVNGSVYGLSASIRSKHHESRAGRLLYPQSQEQLLAQNKPLVNMAEWMNNIWRKAVFWFFKSPLLSLSSCLSLYLLHIQGVEWRLTSLMSAGPLVLFTCGCLFNSLSSVSFPLVHPHKKSLERSSSSFFVFL